MIEINLVPGAKKKKAATSGRGVPSVDFAAIAAAAPGLVRDKFLVGAVAVVVLSVAGAGWLYFSQQKRTAEVLEHEKKGLADSARYATFLADRDAAQARHDTLIRQLNLIESIDADRYIWPHVLDEISRALPQYTWLTVLTFGGGGQGSAMTAVQSPPPPSSDSLKTLAKLKRKPPGPQTIIPHDTVLVKVMGQTVDIDAVLQFMSSLSESPFFGAPVLEQSQPAMAGGKEVTQFQFTAGYTRPDPKLLTRVAIPLVGK